jgi:hypothetical protein
MYISCLMRPSKFPSRTPFKECTKYQSNLAILKHFPHLQAEGQNVVLLAWVTYDERSLIDCKLCPRPGRLQLSCPGGGIKVRRSPCGTNRCSNFPTQISINKWCHIRQTPGARNTHVFLLRTTNARNRISATQG